jgi:hypothetical protein
MSDPLRVALVAEGPTDRIVIEAALRAMLPDRPFVLRQLQPEGSLAFGELGGGWTGVYRWCRQAAARGRGRLADDALLFENYHLLLLHVDADVAGKRYSDGSVTPQSGDEALPCERPCPPASATTNALRSVLLSWCGEAAVPARTVICMPSKSTEAWVVAALFPHDLAMKRGIECFPDPQSRLGQQPKSRRIRKRQADYQGIADRLEEAWPRLAAHGELSEAHRFQADFLACLRAQANTEHPDG